jgi:hypothetical protein
MNIRLAGVCVWRHPNIAKGPLMVGVFAPPLTEDLMTYLRAARPATPNCEPVAPVPLEYRVVLTDTDGRTWQVTVPETAECLGFTLQGERYWVSGLVSALANGTYNAGEVNPPFPTYPAPGTP